MLKVSELYVYPIKSLPGVAVKNATVTDRGFENDRRWMLIDENNRFISQREVPELTQLQVSIGDKGLLVAHKTKNDSVTVPYFVPEPEKPISVTVWDDTCMAAPVSREADQWFTRMVDINCRLVYMSDESRRPVDETYAIDNEITSFSDAYPFLMIGQASLDDLNSRLTDSLTMNRFRPNIVFTGGEPFEEDMIASFKVGNITFFGVKLCARCVIITINQENAVKGKEPTKTLASYRTKNNKIYFGQNLLHQGEGMVSVGDQLMVTGRNHEERFMVNGQTITVAPQGSNSF